MEKKSVKTLREIARKLGLTGYSKLIKEELISVIKAAQKRKKTASSGTSGKKVAKAAKPKAKKATRTKKQAAPKKAAKPKAKKTARTKKQALPRAASEKLIPAAVSGNEEQLIENAKYVTAPPAGSATRASAYPPDLGEDIERLPSLGEPRLTLLMQKPGVLLASWQLDPGHSTHQSLRLRLGVLADQRYNVEQEHEVNTDQGSYYFHVDPTWPPSEIYLQLGYYQDDGRFMIAIRRGIVRLPRLHVRTAIGVNWALDNMEFEREVSQSGPLGRVPHRAVSNAPSSPGWMTSSGIGRRQ